MINALKKQYKLPLFWKFSVAISATVLLFGSINLLFIRNQVYHTFEKQTEKYGINIALSIAERSVEPILYDDLAALNHLLAQTKAVNSDIDYIFIVSPNQQIIAHTFSDFIPRHIIDVNQVEKGMDKSIRLLKDATNSKKIVRDIAVPILENQIGTIRIGMKEDEFLNEIRKITGLFIGMVLFFLILGLIAALIMSYIITNPLKAISSFASSVDFNTFDHKELHTLTMDKQLSVRLKNLFGLKDEIDVLGEKFNQMIIRLQSAYHELKRAHESLSQTEKLASLGTLSAGLAHEVNNPLAGIRNCLRRISDKPENIRQNAEYISMMSEALEKIERVVEGMLNFSRKQEFLFTEVDVKKQLENALNLVKYQITKSNISLTKNYSTNPILVRASSNHLEQVFVNIVLNSIDAVNEHKLVDPLMQGSISINITESKSYVAIEFADNGVGVPDDKVANIFDPFFTLKKIKQGTGLGLAVSYNIIASHKGHIVGQNLQKGGFSVTVTLPYSNEEE